MRKILKVKKYFPFFPLMPGRCGAGWGQSCGGRLRGARCGAAEWSARVRGSAGDRIPRCSPATRHPTAPYWVLSVRIRDQAATTNKLCTPRHSPPPDTPSRFIFLSPHLSSMLQTGSQGRRISIVGGWCSRLSGGFL